LDGHTEQIGLLRFREDGARLLSLDASGKAIRWDTLTWQADQSFVVKLPIKSYIDSYWRPEDVSPDGRLFAFGTEKGDLFWFDAETRELLATTGGDQGITQVAFSGNGSRLASTSIDGNVSLWEPSTFELGTSFKAHLLGAHGVAFSPDCRRLATGGGTSRDGVKLWDLSTYRELITLPGQGTVFKFVAFSNDGKWLAVCGRDKGELYLWRAPSWEEIETEEKRLKSAQFQ
jgi:WD40 repeat protein